MTNKGLYVVIAVLLVALAALGIAYKEETETSGINIEADEDGLSIEAQE